MCDQKLRSKAIYWYLTQYHLIDELKGSIGAYISNFSQIGQKMTKLAILAICSS